jgi:hypothetical protein
MESVESRGDGFIFSYCERRGHTESREAGGKRISLRILEEISMEADNY